MKTTSEDLVQIPQPDWVISDTHLGHVNILDYCPGRKRWAKNIVDHDNYITERWNKLVKPGDTVLHLGDFAFGSLDDIKSYRSRLNGRIILIKGNHDRSKTQMLSAGFLDVVNSAWIRDIYCIHNPAKINTTDHASIYLHGHTHGVVFNHSIRSIQSKLIDCTLEGLSAAEPVPFSEIGLIIKERIKENIK